MLRRKLHYHEATFPRARNYAGIVRIAIAKNVECDKNFLLIIIVVCASNSTWEFCGQLYSGRYH
jgi:hypothetical protein